MKLESNVFSKASGFMLLAFCISVNLYAQEIKSLSGANTPQDDMNPVWIGDNTLLFTRAFHPDNLGGITDPGDIWMTQKSESGQWQEAVHRADLSSEGYDFALGLEDGLTLLVYHNGTGKSGIYQYSKFGREWNFLRQINMPGVTELTGQVSGRVANGGEVMFLSGKGKDSKGNEDIYISEKTGPIDWSEPQNLGGVINTPGQEMSPYYDVNTSQLYFSSNMHPGSNGKDIFIAKKTSEGWGGWSEPKKWEQISSSGSDVSVTFISADEVVWTSTQNSDGFADLLTFENAVPLEIPTDFSSSPTVVVQGEVPAKKAVVVEPIYPLSSVGMPEIKVSEKAAEVKEEPVEWLVIDAKNKTQVPYSLSGINGNEPIELETGKDIYVSQLKGAGITEIKLVANGYFPKNIPVTSLRVGDPTVVLLTKAEPGSTVLLEQVNFKRGTAEIEGDASKLALLELAEFLKQNPEIKLRINGHTDSAGDPGLNKALSLERAGSIRSFLIDEGVPFESLRISGWGGTRPVASNATEAGRSKNRRVELQVEQ